MKLKCLTRYCIGAVLLIYCIRAVAQIPSHNDYPNTELNRSGKQVNDMHQVEMPTTQEWQFHKFGNTPVNLYTGTASVRIPIYTYKDNEFEIPITLDYASNGLMPNVPTGTLGLGWSLNCGGDISRMLNGIEDEFNCSPDIRPAQLRFGLMRLSFKNVREWSAQELEIQVRKTDKEAVTNSIDIFPYVWMNPEFNECKPDTYLFKMFGHSGAFQFAPMAGRKYKVYGTNHPWGEYQHSCIIALLTGTGNAALENYQTIRSFEIKTGDGYAYTFGGGAELLKHTILLDMCPDDTSLNFNDDGRNGDNFYLGINSFAKSSWPLSAIRSPSGRTVTYEYEDSDQSNPLYYEAYSYVEDNDLTGLQYEDKNPERPYSYVDFDNVYSYKEYVSRRLYSRLKTINIDNRIRVTFEYKDKAYEICDLEKYGRHSMKNCGLISRIRIERIEADGQLTCLRTCDLEYRTGKGNPLSMLKKVAISGEGAYTLDYYGEESNFPYAGKKEIDRWGYYADKVDKDQYGKIYPNPNYARRGMLQRITYPTGGSTLYEYEGHVFAQTIAKYTEDRTRTLLAPCTPTKTAGLRIKTITDYLSDGEIAARRSFDYTLDGRCTGNSLSFPRYIIANEKGEEIEMASSIINGARASATLDGTHIEYAAVTETRRDGSKKVYYFSNYRNIPDENINLNNVIYPYDPKSNQISSISPAGIRPVGKEDRNPISMQSQRGKLLCVESYDASNRLVFRETNTYDTQRRLLKNPSFVNDAIRSYFTRQVIDDYPLVSTSRIFYGIGGDSLIQSKKFHYNDKGQTWQTEIPDGQGNLIVSKVKYIADVQNPDTTLQRMAARNMVAYPFRKQVSLRKPDGSEILLSGKGYQYHDFLLHYADTPFPLELVSSTVLPGTVPWGPSSDFAFDEYLENGNIYKYDLYGNVVQETDRMGHSTAYVWGHKGVFLVAKVVGATFEQLQSIQGLGWPDRFIPGNLTDAQIEALYDLEGTQVSVYDYDPYVGVIRTIDPSERETHYAYDPDGKLILTKDDKDQPVQAIEYQIKNR